MEASKMEKDVEEDFGVSNSDGGGQLRRWCSIGTVVVVMVLMTRKTIECKDIITRVIQSVAQ